MMSRISFIFGTVFLIILLHNLQNVVNTEYFSFLRPDTEVFTTSDMYFVTYCISISLFPQCLKARDN